MKKLIILCLNCLLFTGVFSQTSLSPLDCISHFYHGVASGDPLSDAVILWTRVTPDNFASPVVVNYKVALDTAMTNVVNQGSILTDATKDFTVKVDATGLQPDTYYFYEFSALGSNSPRGRTKTAPENQKDSLRFAVVSCANLEAGYFNVYEAVASRNDIEAVLMLGDYIYEYEEGGYGQNTGIDRIFDPTHETISLEDYRLRYSVYHMDKSLQKLHQNYPWICVWDDHETANDSYMNGAENHSSNEGLWSDRKMMAQKAYFEWLPIRPKAPNNYEIYRKFEYGNILDLFMVDTRLIGREEQGVNVNDPNRTILGVDQYDWLTNELNLSTAQWKVLGNQVIFAPVTIFGVPINGDAWDGYPAERDNVLNFVEDNNIENFTVITGDVHTSWAFDLENGSNNVGVEFVTPSVTSPGSPINVGGVLTLENPHIKYVELTKHGFIILDMNQQRIQADWFFVNTIDQIDPSYSWVKSLYSNSGVMKLNNTTTAAIPSAQYDVMMAPMCPRIVVPSTSNITENSLIELIGIYPNPAKETINILFVTESNSEHSVSIVDLSGKEIKNTSTFVNVNSSTLKSIDLTGVESGTYFLRISDGKGEVCMKKFIKL
jgi:alkaline phosphatase D